MKEQKTYQIPDLKDQEMILELKKEVEKLRADLGLIWVCVFRCCVRSPSKHNQEKRVSQPDQWRGGPKHTTRSPSIWTAPRMDGG